MFVDPFRESFLLDCIAFICGKRKRNFAKRESNKNCINFGFEVKNVDSIIVKVNWKATKLETVGRRRSNLFDIIFNSLPC